MNRNSDVFDSLLSLSLDADPAWAVRKGMPAKEFYGKNPWVDSEFFDDHVRSGHPRISRTAFASECRKLVLELFTAAGLVVKEEKCVRLSEVFALLDGEEG